MEITYEVKYIVDIEVLRNVEPDQDWVNLHGEYDQFHVYGDYDLHEDYVEYTAALMQKAAITCFAFPFYIHFEGYEDEIDSIVLHQRDFPIYYQNSGRKVLTTSDGKTYHAEIPSFTVKIINEDSLQKAFAEWFHLAMENCMWIVTQDFDLYYKNQFAHIDMEQQSIILLADHDAHSVSFITNDPSYRKEDYLRLVFEDV